VWCSLDFFHSFNIYVASFGHFHLPQQPLFLPEEIDINRSGGIDKEEFLGWVFETNNFSAVVSQRGPLSCMAVLILGFLLVIKKSQIFTYIWMIFMGNVGKYMPYMDFMETIRI